MTSSTTATATRPGTATRPTGTRPTGTRLPTPATGYVEAASGCRVVVTTPAVDPALWDRYLAGAEATYARHGVSAVVDRAALADGTGTSLVFVVLDEADEVVGGVRVRGPLRRVEDAHALVELAGSPSLDEVRRVIGRRLDEGVVEVKTAWVSPTAPCPRALAAAIPRAALHAASLLGARHAVFTSAVHTVRTWCTSGAVMVEGIVPAAYPDDRYRTALGWLDRETAPLLAEPAQVRETLAEQAQLHLAAQVAA